MTVSELYKHTAQLGFETSLEDVNRFYYAANRALLQINAIRPNVAALKINHRTIKNLLPFEPGEVIVKGDELVFEAVSPKSYSFVSDGNGLLIIECFKNGEWEPLDFGRVNLISDGAYVLYRDFIKKDGAFFEGIVRMRFSGEHLYSVGNIAMYAETYSDSTSDIPIYAPYVCFDLSKLADGFLGFCESVLTDDITGEPVMRGYKIEGRDKLLLPISCPGIYSVNYIRRPRELSITANPVSDDTKIDLDDEMCALLPNLIASYVWAEDEPQLAEYYLTLYREQIAIIESKKKNYSPGRVIDVLGWC